MDELSKAQRVMCIWTSFWVLRAPKRWLKYFVLLFSTLFVYFIHFSVIFWSEIKKKTFEKLGFKLLFKAGWHANAGHLPEGVPQICLFQLIFFQTEKY